MTTNGNDMHIEFNGIDLSGSVNSFEIASELNDVPYEEMPFKTISTTIQVTIPSQWGDRMRYINWKQCHYLVKPQRRRWSEMCRDKGIFRRD